MKKDYREKFHFWFSLNRPHAFNNNQIIKKQKFNLFTHILNLNTVTLQISKETLFEAGKSNRTKNNKNLST